MIKAMDINWILLRQISVLSIFFGVLLGCITLIPYIGTVSFVFLICVGLMMQNANFFILVVISVFLGVLGATVNAFTGFLTFCVLDLINSVRK